MHNFMHVSPIPGILQQEHWSGLPFPSPMHETEKWKWIWLLATRVMFYVNEQLYYGCSNFKLFFNFLVLNYGKGLWNREFKLHIFYFLEIMSRHLSISIYIFLFSLLTLLLIQILFSYCIIHHGQSNSLNERIPKWGWERWFINLNG